MWWARKIGRNTHRHGGLERVYSDTARYYPRRWLSGRVRGYRWLQVRGPGCGSPNPGDVVHRLTAPHILGVTVTRVAWWSRNVIRNQKGGGVCSDCNQHAKFGSASASRLRLDGSAARSSWARPGYYRPEFMYLLKAARCRNLAD